MRTKLLVIAFAVGPLLTCQAQAQTADSLFPKGELSTTKNHTGDIWLSELNVGDSTFDPSIAHSHLWSRRKARLAYSSRWSSSADHRRHWLLPGTRKTGPNRSEGRRH